MHIKNKECVKKKEHMLKINNTGQNKEHYMCQNKVHTIYK
jgi:hypothetical protein